MTTKVFAFAGSTRAGSYNEKLVRLASSLLREQGVETLDISLKDYPLPLVDEDLEKKEGLPANAVKLKKIFDDHAYFIVACPEYNGSVPPLLKNAIDWVSRPHEKRGGLDWFKGKTVLLLSASPGNFGALRGSLHLRDTLMQLQCVVLPGNFAVPKAHEAFAEDGKLKDSKQLETLRGVVSTFAKFIK